MPSKPSPKRFRKTPVLTVGQSDFAWPENGACSEIDGCTFRITGVLEKMKGVRELISWTTNPFKGKRINSMTEFRIPNGPSELVYSYGTKIEYARRTGTKAISGLENRYDAPEPYYGEYFASRAGWLYATNGRDGNMKWNGKYAAPVGVSDIPTAPTADVLIGSFLNSRYSIDNTSTSVWTFQYRCSFVNSAGAEGPLGPVGSDTTTGNGLNKAVIRVGSLANPTQSDIVYRNIYKRAKDGTYYFWRQLSAFEGVAIDHEEPLDTSASGTPAPETLGPPPTAKFVQFFRGRAYYAQEDSRFVFYSDAGLPEQLSSALQFIEVGGADEPISGMTEFADSLIVFKPSSIWQVTTLADGTPVVTPVAQGVGSVAPRASVLAYDRLVFVGERGVYSFDGGSVRPMSNGINHWWKNTISQDWLRNATSLVDEEERRLYVFVACGADSFLDTTLVYHYETDSWSFIEGQRVSASTTYKGLPLVGVGALQDGSSNTVYDICVWGLSNDFGTPGYSIPNGSPSGTATAGEMKGRVRFGPWSGNESVWNRGEVTEWLGVDVFFEYTGAHTLTLRWFLDRNPVAEASTTFQLNQDGVLSAIAANRDLTSLAGWDEKEWGGGTWNGNRLLFMRVYFPDSVLAKELEIEFENDSDDEPFALRGMSEPIIGKGAEQQR